MTDEQMPDRAVVAIHEAGHAVVALLTGFSVRYVSMAPRRFAGVTVVGPGSRRTRSWQEQLVITCAGMIAEDVAGANDRFGIVEASHAGDVDTLREEARAWSTIDGRNVLELAAQAWATAFDLVTANFGAIDAVAAKLHASCRAVPGTQIRACIDTAPRVRRISAPADGRTFWVPEYSTLRNWGHPARRRKAAN